MRRPCGVVVSAHKSRVDLASRLSRVTISTPRGSISAGVATSRKDHRLQTIDRAAPNSRKSETIAARRPNSFSARSVVFEPPGCPPSPLPETGLVAAGLCWAETVRPFKEQLALTAVACMPDEHSVPALIAVALRSAMARTGRQREVG